jgi:polyribonucleotide nucleotidyltransferase
MVFRMKYWKSFGSSQRRKLHILEEIKKTLAQPRETLKPNAPRMVSFKIDKEFIGAVIGPGGKGDSGNPKRDGTTIVLEEVGNSGVVSIYAPDEKAVSAAESRIKAIVAVPEVGQVYDGKVKSITSFGAFIEFMPGKEGLLHISEIKWERLENMDGVLEPVKKSR